MLDEVVELCRSIPGGMAPRPAANLWFLYLGYVKAEVVEVALFGAETVRSTFVRGIANHGYEDS